MIAITGIPKLKPCPFCGAEVEPYDISMCSGGITDLKIQCVCGIEFRLTTEVWKYQARIPKGSDDGITEIPRTDLIGKWNTRADMRGETE